MVVACFPRSDGDLCPGQCRVTSPWNYSGDIQDKENSSTCSSAAQPSRWDCIANLMTIKFVILSEYEGIFEEVRIIEQSEEVIASSVNIE